MGAFNSGSCLNHAGHWAHLEICSAGIMQSECLCSALFQHHVHADMQAACIKAAYLGSVHLRISEYDARKAMFPFMQPRRYCMTGDSPFVACMWKTLLLSAFGAANMCEASRWWMSKIWL